MLETESQRGRGGPSIAFTDDVVKDKPFLLQHMPSIRASEDYLNSLPVVHHTADNAVPQCQLPPERIQVVKTLTAARQAFHGILSLMLAREQNDRVIGVNGSEGNWG
jgi:hypothetical protein